MQLKPIFILNHFQVNEEKKWINKWNDMKLYFNFHLWTLSFCSFTFLAIRIAFIKNPLWNAHDQKIIIKMFSGMTRSFCSYIRMILVGFIIMCIVHTFILFLFVNIWFIFFWKKNLILVCKHKFVYNR